MENNLLTRFKRSWNAFLNRDPTYGGSGYSYYYRPDRPQFSRGNERSIVTAVYNRMSLDVSACNIKHVRLDDNGRYKGDINSCLNNCLTVEANIDQTARAFIQDIVISLLDEGCVAVVPIDTTGNPFASNSYDILTMRTGRIIQWYPNDIKVEAYNDVTGTKQEIIVPKKTTAIIENPLYSVINEPNSTMQRLIRKLNLLDYIDEQTSSGKLNLIVQLPYTIKTDIRRQQAERRRKDIEDQLTGTKYGIAYTDETEKIIQLNRAVENNLLDQISSLTELLFSQLGLTTEIMNGTANEATMNNYFERTITPILNAITEEMLRKFLTKTARSQKQAIQFFRDPFKLIPTTQIAEISDKLTRNEIMTSNEIRQIIGLRPAEDPNADELRNKNLSAPKEDRPDINELINEESEE